MAAEQSTTHRIAHNSLMLSLRTIISMVVGLYTSRVVLQTLGVVDYGIYGVVGGIVTMFVFVNASLNNATTRFIAFEQGFPDISKQKDIFSSAFLSHLLIAVFIFLIAQTLGLFIFLTQISIPTERQNASLWVYQFSIISAIIGVVQTPFTATIVAHEKMDVYAWFELLNVSLKLLVVWLLQVFTTDHLITYGILSLGVSIVLFCCYCFYCVRNFIEVRIKLVWRPRLIRQLLSFTGWTLYADGSVAIRQQGINILYNRFFGIILNASVSIALMVQGVFWLFGHNVIAAFQPQIVKQFAVNNIANFERMMVRALQFTLLSALIISIPVIFSMKFLLGIWLGTVPNYAVLFCQLLLLDNIIGLINHLFSISILASGEIRLFSIINGSIKLISLPVIFFILKDYPYPAVPYLVGLAVVALLTGINLGILKKNIPLISIGNILQTSLTPLLVSLVGVAAILPFNNLLGEGWLHFILVSVLFVLIVCLGSYFFVFDQVTRVWLNRRLSCILK